MVQLLVLMEALEHQRKKIYINFTKEKTKFSLNLHDNADKSYLFANGKEINKFKASNKNNSFPSQFCLESISNEFDNNDLALKRNVYDFSIDYRAIDISNILNILKCLMINNIGNYLFDY